MGHSEVAAGEPSARGIHQLKPSDPLRLWEGGRGAEVEEERESYIQKRR